MDKRIDAVYEMTVSAIENAGYSLYHLEYINEEGEDILRFYISHRDSDEAITLDDCEKVSRMVSQILDENDPIEEHYILEVQSPGLFRPLFTENQRKDALGERVRVRLREDFKGKKNYLGILKSTDSDKITVSQDGKDWEISVSDIRELNLEPEI